MNEICGCCEGLEKLTPMIIANRPGLDAVAYRVGTHATFLKTMKARLTDLYLEVPSEGGVGEKKKIYPLRNLTTRDAGDPAIALLDAWATIADVLSFYQERIANEGYLRTATERRSILELARLVGYKLRPGVAASVYLSFTLEKGYKVEIPAGTRAQSLPGPGELPQSFETTKPIKARAEWNDLKPRLTRPQWIHSDNAGQISTICFDGIATNLKPNDPLLFIFGDYSGGQVLRWVKAVEPQSAENRTKVTLQSEALSSTDASLLNATKRTVEGPPKITFADLLTPLLLPPSKQPANALRLERTVKKTFAPKADIAPRIFTTLKPKLKDTLYKAWSEAKVTEPSKLQGVEALRVKAAPFGHNAPLKPIYDDQGRIIDYEEWPLAIVVFGVRLSSEESLGYDHFASPIQALVSITRNAKTSRAEAELNLNQEIPINLSVGGLNIEITIEKIGEYISKISFRVLEQEIELQMTDSQNLVVKIDGYEGSLSAGTSDAYNDPMTGRNISTRFAGSGQTFSLTLETSPAPMVEELRQLLQGEVALDASYDKVTPGSWVLIIRADRNKQFIRQVERVQAISKADYGITGKVTQLILKKEDSNQDWLDSNDQFLSALRNTTIHVQSESLDPVEELIEDDVAEDTVELDGFYDGLGTGRWVIVSGERTDIPGTSGVRGSELVMIAGVTQDVQKVPLSNDTTIDRPGDTAHTRIHFANSLAYKYKRDTVTIYGNVVKATHGETREEVLGSGDGSKVLQSFSLSQSPLTHLAAATPAGAESTLKVRVNDVLWHETDNIFELGPNDRGYITRTDNKDISTIVFGNGHHGARLPTGIENVTAVYRFGIGKAGNVVAKKISLLSTRPLGVKGVINPLSASGGADREGRDQARCNIPLAVMALDRLVSVKDYADFARTFAGIGKASSTRLSDGRRQVVHITIAGADDIPIDVTSDLYCNLCQALHRFGDPHQPIQVEVRELMLLVISAGVRLLPDYQWESVEPQIRTALLDTFSFDRRQLGQDVVLSEVISVIQRVAGVAYVDVDILDSVSEDISPDELEKLADDLKLSPRIVAKMGRIQTYHVVKYSSETCSSIAGRYGITEKELRKMNSSIDKRLKVKVDISLRIPRTIKAAQLAYLSPEVPDTLILQELTS